MLPQQFIDEMKQLLLARKKQLEIDLAGLMPHTEMGNEIEDNAAEIELDEASQDIISVMRADLDKINKALLKIDNGSYGLDDNGKEISQARLRAIPWADKNIEQD